MASGVGRREVDNKFLASAHHSWGPCVLGEINSLLIDYPLDIYLYRPHRDCIVFS